MIVANKCIPRPVASRKIKLLTTLRSIPNSLFDNSCFMSAPFRTHLQQGSFAEMVSMWHQKSTNRDFVDHVCESLCGRRDSDASLTLTHTHGPSTTRAKGTNL
jgi:hypothetical protein